MDGGRRKETGKPPVVRLSCGQANSRQTAHFGHGDPRPSLNRSRVCALHFLGAVPCHPVIYAMLRPLAPPRSDSRSAVFATGSREGWYDSRTEAAKEHSAYNEINQEKWGITSHFDASTRPRSHLEIGTGLPMPSMDGRRRCSVARATPTVASTSPSRPPEAGPVSLHLPTGPRPRGGDLRA